MKLKFILGLAISAIIVALFFRAQIIDKKPKPLLIQKNNGEALVKKEQKSEILVSDEPKNQLQLSVERAQETQMVQQNQLHQPPGNTKPVIQATNINGSRIIRAPEYENKSFSDEVREFSERNSLSDQQRFELDSIVQDFNRTSDEIAKGLVEEREIEKRVEDLHSRFQAIKDQVHKK